jgi:hypothetical protein
MKHKLALDLDALTVESFDTSGPRMVAGTVRGNDISDTTCQQIICDCPTGSGSTCVDTCGDTCDDTCACSGQWGCETYTNLSCCNAPLSYCVCTPGGTCL